MNRTTRIGTEYDSDISRAVQRFADHEDMSEIRVLKWLEQFSDQDLPLAARVMASVKYHNRLSIRSMTKDLFQITTEELDDRELRTAAFVPVGTSGAGSSYVARVLREQVRGTRHRVIDMLQVSRLQPSTVSAIVFVDDFSGTGQTLRTWWDNIEPLVRPTGAVVFVGLLLLNEPARQHIEKFADVLAVETLDASNNVFGTENVMFSPSDKEALLEYCRRTGCSSEYERGRGQCGLLLAFKYSCPNNSIPVLWYSDRGWKPLFNRRAI